MNQYMKMYRLNLKRFFAMLLLIGGYYASGGTVALLRTPILNATLAGGTYQVEVSTNGSVWQPTGVLVVGNSSPSAVRLDGYSTRLAYRYAQVGTTEIVVPTVTQGLSLSNTFPGATELRIEANPTLSSNNWSFSKFVFPDFNGALISPVSTSTQRVEFFRTVQPAQPLKVAAITSYPADPNMGVSGFGPVADDMPQLYRDGFICAPCVTLYNRDGANAAAAGECYELTGPVGVTTVMVADENDFPPAGTCEIGVTYFDIGNIAFTNLFAESTGSGTATCRLVPAPVTGNVKLLAVANYDGYYVELRPYNHRAGINKLEIRVNGSSNWTELPRAAYNSFIYNGNPPFPMEVRVTSRFGEIINCPPISALTTGQRLSASNQFVIFPEQAPAPVWKIPTVYTDNLNDQYGGKWYAIPYGGAIVNPQDASAAYQGTAGISISDFGSFNGVTFYGPNRFPKPTDGSLEFAIKTSNGTPTTQLALEFSGVNEFGLSVDSSTVQLPAISNNWQTIRIPLDQVHVPFRIQQFRLMNSSGTPAPPTAVDAIRFSQP